MPPVRISRPTGVAAAALLLAHACPAVTEASNLLEDTVAPERPIDVALALDAGGTPHIAYTIGTSLKYAVKSGGAWTVTTVDSTGLYQSSCAIAVDAAGAPHVCWSPNGAWYAEKTSGSWSKEPVDPTAASSQLTLTLDAAGGVLNHAGRADTGWVKDPVDGSGWGPSIVLDAEGDPHVAYAKPTGPLKYAVRKNGMWSRVTVDSVATSGGSGYFDPPSLELDSDGDPHMSYMANDPDYNIK